MRYRTKLAGIAMLLGRYGAGQLVQYVQELLALNDNRFAVFKAGATYEQALLYSNYYQPKAASIDIPIADVPCFFPNSAQFIRLEAITEEHRLKCPSMIEWELSLLSPSEALEYLKRKYDGKVDNI